MGAEDELLAFLRRVETRKALSAAEKAKIRENDRLFREREARKASHRVCIGTAGLCIASMSLCINLISFTLSLVSFYTLIFK